MSDRELRDWEAMEQEWTVPALLDALEADGPLTLLERLKGLVPILERHFALEERPGGFFDQMVALEPSTDSRVASLREDHVHILDSLGALITDIETDGHSPGRLREARRLLATKIREHQRQEYALLQETVLRDTGVGD